MRALLRQARPEPRTGVRPRGADRRRPSTRPRGPAGAWSADQQLELSRTEFDPALELLVFNADRPRPTRIYEGDSKADFGPDSKNLATHHHLRRKIDEGEDVKLIHTVRGVGYTLRES